MDISKALQIKGWMAPDELEWLAEQASKSNCIIEIGTYYGRSARAMADNMPKDALLYCIDPYSGRAYYESNVTGAMYSGNYIFQQAQKNLAEFGGRVTFHRGTTQDFPYHIKPDFIFIDGDHTHEAVLKDIEFALAMKPRVIAGHDYIHNWAGVVTAVNEKFPTVGVVNTIWYLSLPSH